MPRPVQVDEGGEGGYIFPPGESARLSYQMRTQAPQLKIRGVCDSLCT